VSWYQCVFRVIIIGLSFVLVSFHIVFHILFQFQYSFTIA